MELEKEIKQSKFRSEQQKAAVNIFYTNNWLRDKMSVIFKRYDISIQQYNILRILRGQRPNPSTVNLLKDRMLDKMSDASRLVERLKQKGLVARETSENDRRTVDIFITDKGLKLLVDIDKDEQSMDSFFSCLDEKELKQMSKLLDKLRG